MESNSLLHPSHHGFRAGRSTATALLELHDNWVEAFDRKEVTAVMLLDLSAAFDVVSHPILFNKLEAYGFDSGSINWIKSYLTDRQQSVYVDGILSPPLKVNIGVPQGSILGPLLYTIFTNDLPQVVHNHEGPYSNQFKSPFSLPCSECGGICAFADDSTFSISRSDTTELNEALNAKYQTISDYMAANKLMLNADKTHVLVLTSSRQHSRYANYGIELNTGSNLIQPSTNEKLLGVNVSNDFTWNVHILQMVRNLTVKNNGLKRVCWLLDFKSRKIIANGVINSQLIYCVQLYGAASDYLIKYLQVQQNRAARTVTRLARDTNISVLLGQVGWLSVKQLYVYHCLLLIFKKLSQQRVEYFSSKFSRRFPYATRGAANNLFSMNRIPKTEIFKSSFFYNSITLWNSLPMDIKNSTESSEFKRKLKKWTQDTIPLV